MPLRDLGLFARKGAGIVREIVGFGVVDFDGVEELVAGLGEERVDVEGQGVVVGREGVGREKRVGFNGGDRGWFVEGGWGWWGG